MMDELRCGECNYLLNPYAQECPKCGEKVDPLDRGRWFLRSAASTTIVLVWALVIYAGAPIPPWTIIPVGVVALAIVIRERMQFRVALEARRKRLEDLARMSGQIPVPTAAAAAADDAADADEKKDDEKKDDEKKDDDSQAEAP